MAILNFLDKNVAAELVLTVPQKHTVRSSVPGADLGALTNLRKVSHDEVNDAVYRLSHRPRTCLGYRTSHEVFFGLEMQPIKLANVALCT